MSLQLLCFCTDASAARAVIGGGAAALVIDWERGDKRRRQDGHDTQISTDTPEDLARVRAATAAPIVCRINGVGPDTAAEVERAIELGADEILVPMIRGLDDVERVLERVDERVGVGVLIETEDAVADAAQIATAPLCRIYVGLNDLRIERGLPTIFDPFLDGTLAAVREAVGDIPFGVGGLTVPGAGAPVPAELLMGEILRLRCDFTFLRRSFWRAAGNEPAAAIAAIHGAIANAAQRSPEQVASDRAAFARAVTPLLLGA